MEGRGGVGANQRTPWESAVLFQGSLTDPGPVSPSSSSPKRKSQPRARTQDSDTEPQPPSPRPQAARSQSAAPWQLVQTDGSRREAHVPVRPPVLDGESHRFSAGVCRCLSAPTQKTSLPAFSESTERSLHTSQSTAEGNALNDVLTYQPRKPHAFQKPAPVWPAPVWPAPVWPAPRRTAHLAVRSFTQQGPATPALLRTLGGSSVSSDSRPAFSPLPGQAPRQPSRPGSRETPPGLRSRCPCRCGPGSHRPSQLPLRQRFPSSLCLR